MPSYSNSSHRMKVSQEEIFMNVGSHSTVLTGLLAVRDLSTGACQLCAMSYNIDIQQRDMFSS